MDAHDNKGRPGITHVTHRVPATTAQAARFGMPALAWAPAQHVRGVARRGLYGESMPDAPPRPSRSPRRPPRGARGPPRAAARDSLAGRARGGRVVARDRPRYLRELVAYWADGFDWPAQEAALARFPTSASASMASGSTSCTSGPPLRLGQSCRWSSATAGRIRSGATSRSSPPHRPGAHGADPPTRSTWSCPTCRASATPTARRPAPDSIAVAGLWAELMGVLGYARFGAAGGDIGSHVSRYLALDHADRVVAVHRIDAACRVHRRPGGPRARGARLVRGRCGLGRDRGRLRCDAPHQAPDRRLRAHRLAGRARGVDRGEAPGVERLRRRGRTALHQGRDPHERHALLAHGHDRLVDAHVPRERRDPPRSLPAGSRCRRASRSLPATSSAHPSVARAYGERRTRYEFACGGHFAPFEEPELYAEELRAFFRPYRRWRQAEAVAREWRGCQGLAQVGSRLARNSPESAGSLSHPARDRSVGCHSHDDWATLLVPGR